MQRTVSTSTWTTSTTTDARALTLRDAWVGVVVAIVAAALLTVAIGAMVTADVSPGRHTTDDGSVATAGGVYRSADRVPILCYHYVRPPGGPLQLVRVFGYVVLSLPLMDDSELWKVTRRGFEQQMKYLVTRGYHTVTLDEVHEWEMGRRNLPAKSVVLTFDDGEESAYDYVYPVLEKYGLKATMFVVTSRVGTRWNGMQCVDWKQLREMQRSGLVDIESHTHDLHYKVGAGSQPCPVYLAQADDPTQRAGEYRTIFEDLSRSRVTIEKQIGRTPHFLAWPYGFGNAAVDQLAIDAGFTRTLSLRARPNRPVGIGGRILAADTERFEMPRYTVTARTSLRDFHAMLDGTFDPAR